MSSCQRCKQTSNGPQAFLLTCRGCSKTWHHRCHMPPVEDGELIQRIRATNARDTANDLGSWMCRRCKKGIPVAPTVASDSHEDRKSWTSTSVPAATNITTSTASLNVPPAQDVRVKQESSTAVEARILNDWEQNKTSDRQESIEVAPAKRTLTAKRIKPSAAKQLHVQPRPEAPTQPRDADVQMADTTPTKCTPHEKASLQRPPSPLSLLQAKSARKFVNSVPATSSEDDVEMEVEAAPPAPSELTSRTTSRASQTPFSDNQPIRPMPVVQQAPHVHAASPICEREREVRPADEVAAQRQVNQVITNGDDDPEDLYGPPVERRIIRILPSLAEELKEQQRRAAAEKEKRRAPLASDWILAKHMHDPLWKEIPTARQKRGKATARRLGDNGLDVNELMGCFTVQNWLREHKT